jgi:hypothetical protein
MELLRSVAAYTRKGQIRNTRIWEELTIFNILYRVGGTCKDYRLRHLIFHTPLFADYARRYYNRSVTSNSLTNCVDHSLFLSALLTVDYFCRLSALVVSSFASYQLTYFSCDSPLL